MKYQRLALVEQPQHLRRDDDDMDLVDVKIASGQGADSGRPLDRDEVESVHTLFFFKRCQ